MYNKLHNFLVLNFYKKNIIIKKIFINYLFYIGTKNIFIFSKFLTKSLKIITFITFTIYFHQNKILSI